MDISNLLKRKTLITLFAFLQTLSSGLIFAQNKKEELSPVKFEHLRINVEDKEKSAKWYVENVGLQIIPSSNKDVVYVADQDHNFMIEFSSIPHLRTTYFDIDIDAFHLAFEGHKSIESVAEKMLANNAIQEGKLYRNKIGDYVINVRDPNGFSSQLLHRVNPFFSKPVKGTLRFEHFAYNTADQKTTALWMVEFMSLIIPWSKDIDSNNNNYRNYRVPYIGDVFNSMSIELFAKPEIELTFAKMRHEEVHIAYASNDPEKLALRMVYGGANILRKSKNANGEIIIDLVDPYNFPIRLIKRKMPILKK